MCPLPHPDLVQYAGDDLASALIACVSCLVTPHSILKTRHFVVVCLHGCHLVATVDVVRKKSGFGRKLLLHLDIVAREDSMLCADHSGPVMPHISVPSRKFLLRVNIPPVIFTFRLL